MNDEVAVRRGSRPSSPTTSPKSSPSKRLHGRASNVFHSRLTRKDSNEESKAHTRGELSLAREFIDFDVIKGSAFFHTKPANHDKKLVEQGFRRALLLPLHRVFWRDKSLFYEVSTCLYLLHLVAGAIYFLSPESTSTLSSFEVFFPILLLVVVAIEYGRVTSALQAGDVDPSGRLCSPTKQQHNDAQRKHGAHAFEASSSSPVGGSSTAIPHGKPTLASPTHASRSHPHSPRENGLGTEFTESENSDNTDSDDENGDDSSSSSDEAAPEDVPIFSAAAPSPVHHMFPGTPQGPQTPQTAANFFDNMDHLARRRVTVCVWENGVPVKKSMSVAELRNTILAKVKATPPRMIYRKIAKCAAITLAIVPVVFRIFLRCQEADCFSVLYDPIDAIRWLYVMTPEVSSADVAACMGAIPFGCFIISLSCMLSTYHLGSIIFTTLADAEVTYHRRFLYAKCFTALTSSRRSRLSNLPHFRLKNVVNIKAWISLRGGRTWLKRQGRQRAADEIVSTLFLINLVLLAVMGMQAVSDNAGGIQGQHLVHVEVTMWCLLSCIFMLRFMMLGSNINKKYQNTSLLLTEQMNLYLRLLVKPHKKEKLLVSNNVLKLASKLLKELNSPNKVSGLTMNPLLYNITRVVVLSAFSSAASEFFGFKLKLWKMKTI